MISNVIFGLRALHTHKIDIKFSNVVWVTMVCISVKIAVNHLKYSNVIPFYVISNVTQTFPKQTSFPVLRPLLKTYWHQI